MTKNNNKIRALDLFAGAGGFGLGLRLSGHFQVVCSLEVDKWAVETLQANNHEKHKIIQGDIRKFTTSEQILAACPFKPEIIIGGPPCQGFSYAGPTKDPKDPRNSLFINYVQWVSVLKPKVFVMENVKGILTGENEKGERVIEIIKSSFEKIGYTVKIWELNAANYGVPQQRHRVFIVGNVFGAEIPEPPITHFLPIQKESLNGHAYGLKEAINVNDAISDLPKLRAGEGQEEMEFNINPESEYQKLVRDNSSKIYNHVTMSHTKRVVERYEKIISGIQMQDIPIELQVRKRNGNGEISESEYNSNYRHLKPNMIAYTIPASFYSNFVHPDQPRNITSREAARLQSFPDSYIFKGKRTQVSSKLLKRLGKDHENYLSQYNQIGNAVPPLLAKAIAEQINNFLREVKSNSKKRIVLRSRKSIEVKIM